MNYRKVSQYCKACLIMSTTCETAAVIFESKELMVIGLVFFIGAVCFSEDLVTVKNNRSEFKSRRLTV